MISLRISPWLALALAAASPASAQEATCTDRARCGEVSPLIPMQSTEAVHMGLVWKSDSSSPKILFHSRFPEYTPNDVADPDRVDAAIAAGALSNGTNDFNAAARRQRRFRSRTRPSSFPRRRESSDLSEVLQSHRVLAFAATTEG